MAYAVDGNYENVNKDVEQYLSEQQKLQADIANNKLFTSNGIKIGAAAVEFKTLADEQDRIDGKSNKITTTSSTIKWRVSRIK